MYLEIFSNLKGNSKIHPNVISSEIFNVGVNEWKIVDTPSKMKQFKNEPNLIFYKIGDINIPELKFENCEYVVFTKCDINFISNVMNSYKFQNVKEIYLDNICDLKTFEIWNNSGITMHISPKAYVSNRRLSDMFHYINKIKKGFHLNFMEKILPSLPPLPPLSQSP